MKTNVLGTENVLTAAIKKGVKSAICLSTDKAAYPVNAMGTSRAMMDSISVYAILLPWNTNSNTTAEIGKEN